MIRRPPRSTLFPTRRSSDLGKKVRVESTFQIKHRLLLWWLKHQAAKEASDAAIVADTKASVPMQDRKSTRLNSSHSSISYAVFCLKKKRKKKKIKNVNRKSA